MSTNQHQRVLQCLRVTHPDHRIFTVIFTLLFTMIIPVNRQLDKLFEHREALKSEIATLTERLNNELMTQRDLQRDLHSARSSETEMMRLKEQVGVVGGGPPTRPNPWRQKY